MLSSRVYLLFEFMLSSSTRMTRDFPGKQLYLFLVCFHFSAIFLLDAAETVYLWFGWWPDDEEGTEASNSRRRRWDEERRKAMESAVAYANGSFC